MSCTCRRCGEGSYALGHGVEKEQPQPRRVQALAAHRVVCVSCGEDATAMITSCGGLWIVGCHPTGSVTTEYRALSDISGQQLESGDWWHEIGAQRDLSTAEFHQQGGSQWSDGFSGSIGPNKFVLITADTPLHDDPEMQEYLYGPYSVQPEQIAFPATTNAGQRPRLRSVSCGPKHFAAIDSNGTLYSWGNRCGGAQSDTRQLMCALGHGFLSEAEVLACKSPRPVVFSHRRPARSQRQDEATDEETDGDHLIDNGGVLSDPQEQRVRIKLMSCGTIFVESWLYL